MKETNVSTKEVIAYPSPSRCQLFVKLLLLHQFFTGRQAVQVLLPLCVIISGYSSFVTKVLVNELIKRMNFNYSFVTVYIRINKIAHLIID